MIMRLVVDNYRECALTFSRNGPKNVLDAEHYKLLLLLSWDRLVFVSILLTKLSFVVVVPLVFVYVYYIYWWLATWPWRWSNT